MGKKQDSDVGAEGVTVPGRQEWSGTLVLTKYAGYVGELVLYRRGQEEEVLRLELPATQAVLLLVLYRAWLKDGDRRGPRRRGYRPQRAIAAEKQKLEQKHTPVDERTINVFVGRLRKALKLAWREAGLAGPALNPIETSAKNLGYRLALPLELKFDRQGEDDGQVT